MEEIKATLNHIKYLCKVLQNTNDYRYRESLIRECSILEKQIIKKLNI